MTLEAEDQLAQSGENVFNPHLNSIQNILANLEKIQKSEAVDTNQYVDSWQVAYMFMDVFVHEFKDLAPPEPARSNVVEPKKNKVNTKAKTKETKK